MLNIIAPYDLFECGIDGREGFQTIYQNVMARSTAHAGGRLTLWVENT